MKYEAKNPEEYIAQIPKDRISAFTKLRYTLKENIDSSFEENMQYGMISYVVPHSIFPEGYHCKPTDALPFISIASQKKFIALYHSGLYANKEILEWFVGEFPKHCKRKLDMGKSCVRFKYIDDIPFNLLAELAQKISVSEWVSMYKAHRNK